MSVTPPDSAVPLALEMHQLEVRAMKNPNVTVARDVNWTVACGDFWVVGAPQHSGKTDFLLTAGGFMTPAAGELKFLGETMPIFDEARLPHRLKLGFVFDGGQLLGSLTVAENIALPLRYHARLPETEIAARVSALLEATELTTWANVTPINVARNWQQRAGLARALALTPEVLLLDSPLTGLDARHEIWWLHFLDELARGHVLGGNKPMTLIVTADDLRSWQGHAHQVACLSQSQLLVLGDWAAAANRPEPVVHELLQAW
jgi:ABC-type transporter Mla maintaining outer membrane lipid asymmetry ATPase subunit MlaF